MRRSAQAPQGLCIGVGINCRPSLTAGAPSLHPIFSGVLSIQLCF